MATIKSPLELALPDIFYEDPEPVEDHMLQEPTITNLAFILREWFQTQGNTFVSAGGFVFYNRANGNDRVAPDCYIALDMDPAFVYQFPNYFVWEVGKPPDFVLEVASPSTAPNDLGRKRDLYARLGIGEYWRIDPSGGDLYGAPLTGERLVDGEYVPFPIRVSPDGSITSRSEALRLDFHWNGQTFDILDPLTGNHHKPSPNRPGSPDRRTPGHRRRTPRPISKPKPKPNAERQARQQAQADASAERQARQNAEQRIQALTEELERLPPPQPITPQVAPQQSTPTTTPPVGATLVVALKPPPPPIPPTTNQPPPTVIPA